MKKFKVIHFNNHLQMKSYRIIEANTEREAERIFHDENMSCTIISIEEVK